MPHITPLYQLIGPSPTTPVKDLGAELQAMVVRIEEVLSSFDYNGADPSAALARIAALETWQTANNIRIRVAASAAERDTFFGVPGTAAAQLALQMIGAQCIRSDKSWTEGYFAAFHAVTNPTGVITPGWYPISGALPGTSLTRTARAELTIPNATWYNAAADAQWNDAAPGFARGVPYINGFIIPISGVYNLGVSLRARTNTPFIAGLSLNDNAVASSAAFNLACSGSPTPTSFATASTEKRYTAGDVLRLWIYHTSGAAMSLSEGTSVSQYVQYVRPA